MTRRPDREARSGVLRVRVRGLEASTHDVLVAHWGVVDPGVDLCRPMKANVGKRSLGFVVLPYRLENSVHYGRKPSTLEHRRMARQVL